MFCNGWRAPGSEEVWAHQKIKRSSATMLDCPKFKFFRCLQTIAGVAEHWFLNFWGFGNGISVFFAQPGWSSKTLVFDERIWVLSALEIWVLCSCINIASEHLGMWPVFWRVSLSLQVPWGVPLPEKFVVVRFVRAFAFLCAVDAHQNLPRSQKKNATKTKCTMVACFRNFTLVWIESLPSWKDGGRDFTGCQFAGRNQPEQIQTSETIQPQTYSSTSILVYPWKADKYTDVHSSECFAGVCNMLGTCRGHTLRNHLKIMQSFLNCFPLIFPCSRGPRPHNGKFRFALGLWPLRQQLNAHTVGCLFKFTYTKESKWWVRGPAVCPLSCSLLSTMEQLQIKSASYQSGAWLQVACLAFDCFILCLSDSEL